MTMEYFVLFHSLYTDTKLRNPASLTSHKHNMGKVILLRNTVGMKKKKKNTPQNTALVIKYQSEDQCKHSCI